MSMNPQQISSLLSGIGNIGGFFGNSSMSDTYADIDRMLQEYMMQGRNNLNPFIRAGQNQIKPMQDWSNTLRTRATDFDPGQSLDDAMKNYKMSDYGNYMKNQALETANNQAQISGLYGSGQHIADTTRIANDITSADLQHYLDNYFGQQKYGLELGDQYQRSMNPLYQGGLKGAGMMNQLMEAFANARSQAMQGQGASNAAASGDLFSTLGNMASGFLNNPTKTSMMFL